MPGKHLPIPRRIVWPLLPALALLSLSAAPARADWDACSQRTLGGLNFGFPFGAGVRFGPVWGYQKEVPDYRFALVLDAGIGGAKLSLANYWVFSGVYCTPVTGPDGLTSYRSENEPGFWNNTAVSVDLAATYTWVHHRWRRAMYVGPEISLLFLGEEYVDFMAPRRLFIGLGIPVVGASNRFAFLPTAGLGVSW